MKKSLPMLLALLCGLVFLTQTASAIESRSSSYAHPGQNFAEAISTLTGVAISPLLGASAYGAVKYFRTPEANRANLPWFAQPWFWIPALSLVALCFLKDTAGTALPTAMKKPLDVAETVEHKISGLVATGAFVPFIVMMMNDTAPAPAATLSAMGFAAADFSWLYNAMMMPVAMIAFFIVFMASNAINILILLSPFTTVDAALKGFRLAILGTVAGTAWINPWAGALWALAIIVFSWFIAGWSLRLSHFGLAFIWDFVTFRCNRFVPDPKANKVFLGRKINKVPTRTYGKLTRNEAGRLMLSYRPWLVLPMRTLVLPAGNYAPGRGILYSEILSLEGDDAKTFMLLPPRYRGHEEQLEMIYRFSPTRDVGIRVMWKWFKEFFTGKPQPVGAA